MGNCESLRAAFDSSLNDGCFEAARSSLRALINSLDELPESEDQLDTFELHSRLDPKGVSLELLLTDFTGRPDQLQQAQTILRLNGQEDIALLISLASGAINDKDYCTRLHGILRGDYFSLLEEQAYAYPLGYPNCMEDADLFTALEKQDYSRLQDLLYDGMSRAWDHAFPDYDVLVEQLQGCQTVLASFRKTVPVEMVHRSIEKPWIRFGMASLLDIPIAAVLEDVYGQILPVLSFSPLQIGASLLQGMTDKPGVSNDSIELLSSIPAERRQSLVDGLYFSTILRSAPRLDISPQVLEFASLYGVLGGSFKFILTPSTLDHFPLATTACPAFYRHYPVPFLAETDALKQVFNAVRSCSERLKEAYPEDVIQLPEELVTMQSYDAYECLIQHLSLPAPPADPSELFVRSWDILRMSLGDGAF
jgi:hypothetical protein